MTKIGKLLIGAGVTSLMAWGANHLGGPDFVDNIGAGATSALSSAGMSGVSAKMQTDPLTRTVVLSGEGLSDEQRAAAEAEVLKVAGVGSVVWEGYDDAAAGDGAGAAVSDEAVATCQEGVNAVVAEKEINFKSGSAYMPASSLEVVKEVAEALKPCDGAALAVGGHTDATGSDEVNQKLSQARADAVKAALVENGLGADTISATGFGSSQPKVEGAGANEANRRIEFKLGGEAAETAEPEAETADAETSSDQEGGD